MALLERLPVVPGEAQLFLDEIQACPPALAGLRYFFERVPEPHVVAAGSLLDIGLVKRLCGLDFVGAEEPITVNEGTLAEQFIGQELIAAAPAFEDPRLCYWAREARNADAELDYMNSRGQDVLPVEVKAGKTGALKSLLQFLGEKRRQRAVRFHLGRPSIEEVALPGDEAAKGQLLSRPHYLAGQLDRFLAEAFGPGEAED